MSELIENIFLTSLIIMIVATGYVKLRGDIKYVSFIEQAVTISVWLASILIAVISAIALVWI